VKFPSMRFLVPYVLNHEAFLGRLLQNFYSCAHYAKTTARICCVSFCVPDVLAHVGGEEAEDEGVGRRVEGGEALHKRRHNVRRLIVRDQVEHLQHVRTHFKSCSTHAAHHMVENVTEHEADHVIEHVAEHVTERVAEHGRGLKTARAGEPSDE
jgi:hypothetical protein